MGDNGNGQPPIWERHARYIENMAWQYHKKHRMLNLSPDDFQQAIRMRLFLTKPPATLHERAEHKWVGVVGWRAMVSEARLMESRGRMKRAAIAGIGGPPTPMTFHLGDMAALWKRTYTHELFRQVEDRDQVERVLRSITNLRNRHVLLLYYCHEMSMRTIGEHIGLSESRVCQLINRLVRDLRTRFPALVQKENGHPRTAGGYRKHTGGTRVQDRQVVPLRRGA